MRLHVLPIRTGGAAENMAIDFLLLQRYPDAGAPRFRHYEWRKPAFTFGYGQKLEFVRETLKDASAFDLCRRPTGGGIVDHSDDWTYALVIPRGHPMEGERASRSYNAVHLALAEALSGQGADAVIKEVPDPDAGPPVVCFERAEKFDVVSKATGAKIAGAAQKRNRHGMLFQGSIWKPAAGGDGVDWDRFGADFSARLAAALGAEPQEVPWPELNEEEVSGLIERYGSPEWIALR